MRYQATCLALYNRALNEEKDLVAFLKEHGLPEDRKGKHSLYFRSQEALDNVLISARITEKEMNEATEHVNNNTGMPSFDIPPFNKVCLGLELIDSKDDAVFLQAQSLVRAIDFIEDTENLLNEKPAADAPKAEKKKFRFKLVEKVLTDQENKKIEEVDYDRVHEKRLYKFRDVEDDPLQTKAAQHLAMLTEQYNKYTYTTEMAGHNEVGDFMIEPMKKAIASGMIDCHKRLENIGFKDAAADLNAVVESLELENVNFANELRYEGFKMLREEIDRKTEYSKESGRSIGIIVEAYGGAPRKDIAAQFKI